MTSIAELFAGEPQLVVTAVRGYRSWSLDRATGALASTGVEHIWGVSPAVAAAYLNRAGSGTPGIGPIAHNRVDARCLRGQMHRGPVYPGCTCPACITATTQQRHPAPHAECTCGIYGWYDPADTRIVPSVVFGAVEATGRMILGTHGFRTERARVLAVVATDKPEWNHALLDLGYLLLPDRDALLTEFPPDDMSGLVDHTCDPVCVERRSLIIGGSTTFAQLQAAMASLGTTSVFVAAPPRPPVPRWKRWPLVAGSAALVALSGFGMGLSGWRFAANPSWGDAVIFGLDAVGVYFWRGNLLKAWRWR